MPEIKVNKERCKGCEFCVLYCPKRSISLSASFNSKGYHYPEIVDAEGGTVTFDYEDPGEAPENHCSENAAADWNLCSVTDQGDGVERHTTRFTYDDLGNVLTRTDAGGHAWTFTYTALDDVATETDPRGNCTHYEYGDGKNLSIVVSPTTAFPGSSQATS